jgi:hypothetical protein
MSTRDETGGDWVCFAQKTITQDIVDDGKKRCAWLWEFCSEKPRDHSERDFCRLFATSYLKRFHGGMNTPISKFPSEDKYGKDNWVVSGRNTFPRCSDAIHTYMFQGHSVMPQDNQPKRTRIAPRSDKNTGYSWAQGKRLVSLLCTTVFLPWKTTRVGCLG